MEANRVHGCQSMVWMKVEPDPDKPDVLRVRADSDAFIVRGLIAVLQRFPFVRLPGDVYFIETLPVRPEAGDFAAVILATVALCLAAAWYPAWQASRLDPVTTIRRQA